MPRRANNDVAHTAAADHRILRDPAAAADPRPAAAAGTPWAALPLEPFYKDGLDVRDPEFSRDLAVALGQVIAKGRVRSDAYNFWALTLLKPAAERDPRDVDALQGYAMALRREKRPWPALAVYETALRAEPHHEKLLAETAALLTNLEEYDRAIPYWRRAIAANPHDPQFRGGLASALARRGDWDEARKEVQAYLRLDPDSTAARTLWIECLLHAGRRDDARAELRRVIALHPTERERLQTWYDSQPLR
jgi:tetratricopeptide (TPR) repeat protein